MLFFCFFVSAFSEIEEDRQKPESPFRPSSNEGFCVCDGRLCKESCPMNKILSATAPELRNPSACNDFPEGKLISFWLVQREDSDIPVFSLDAWQNYSVAIYGNSKRAAVELVPGNAGAVSDWCFSGVDVILDNGHFYFDKLMTRAVDWFVKENAKKVVIHQEHLDTDFDSFADIQPPLDYMAPSESLVVHVNRSIQKLTFLADHEIVVEHGQSHAVFDLSQIPSDNKPPLFVMSGKTLFFDFKIDDMSDPLLFPRVEFRLPLGGTVTVDIPELDDNVIDLSDRISFVHGRNTLSLVTADSKIRLPTFRYHGSGAHYENEKTVTFYKSYCICEGSTQVNCSDLCGSLPIVDYSHVSETALGNPNNEIHYSVVGSESAHAKINIAHYGDTNLTVVGVMEGQFVELIGKVQTDTDIVHKFLGLTIVVNGDLEVSDVEFSSCKWLAGDSSRIISDEMVIDFSSLKEMTSKVEIVPPPYGISVEALNILKEVLVELEGPNRILLNGVEVRSCQETRSKITIRAGGDVKIGLGDAIMKEPEIDSLPKVWLKLMGDANSVTFIGNTWPEALSDITAKIMIEHGDNPVRISGEPADPKRFKWKPPIVASIGTGAVYFNNMLANYEDAYCICEGNDCVTLCENHGPICGMDMKSIVSTLDNNPSRSISYIVHHTNKTHMPAFDLDDFQQRSFFITGEKKRQYVLLNGFDVATSSPPTGISHSIRNMKISFGEGTFNFNNLVLENISLAKGSIPSSIDCKGITSDFSALLLLQKEGIVISPTLYMKVLGRENLETVVLAGPSKVSLRGLMGEQVTLHLERLQKPVTIVSKLASQDVPLRIDWEPTQFTSPHSIPRVTIDLTESDEKDVYVVFAGEQMKDSYHNISDRVSILYGQADLHIQSEKNENADFKWQPPHVHAVGSGDYYINGRRQTTLLSRGDHGSDDDEEGGSNFGKFAMVGCMACLCFGLAIYVNRKRRRGIPSYGKPEEDKIDGSALEVNVPLDSD